MTIQLSQAGEPLAWQTTNPSCRPDGDWDRFDIPAINEQMPKQIRHDRGKPMPLNEMQGLALRAYMELLRLKNHSANTISVYRNWFILFLNCFPNHKPSAITKNERMDMLVRFRKSDKWSATSQNQLINAIKFFYEHLLKRPYDYYDLPRAQKPQLLPTVFDESEILTTIKATENLKHKTILCLAYSGGLRVSEIII